MDEPVPTSGGDRVRRTAARHGLAQLGLGVPLPPPPLAMLDQGLVLVAPYPCLPSSRGRGSWGAGARVGSLSDSSLYAPRPALVSEAATAAPGLRGRSRSVESPRRRQRAEQKRGRSVAPGPFRHSILLGPSASSGTLGRGTSSVPRILFNDLHSRIVPGVVYYAICTSRPQSTHGGDSW